MFLIPANYRMGFSDLQTDRVANALVITFLIIVLQVSTDRTQATRSVEHVQTVSVFVLGLNLAM